MIRTDPPVVAFTGHRPDKLGGYDFDNPKRTWLRGRTSSTLQILGPQYCISGMAPGFDQDAAFVCVELGIPFIAAVPFVGQERKWPKPAQEFYNELLGHAYCVYVVSPGGYSAPKMQVRNRWMVDNCDVLIGAWDGTGGGTANCMDYASLKQGLTIHRINPNHFNRS